MTPEEILRALQLTPDKVNELAHGLSPSQLARGPREGEWSMNQIVNHLLVGERDVSGGLPARLARGRGLRRAPARCTHRARAAVTRRGQWARWRARARGGSDSEQLEPQTVVGLE